jgi:ankyrin repeat protein
VAQAGDFVKALEMLQTPRHRSINTRFGIRQFTLLHLAVETKNLDAVKMLLDRGAFVNAPGGVPSNLKNPLIHALGCSTDEIVLYLLERGADPRSVTGCGQNAVNFALDKQRPEEVIQAIVKSLDALPVDV